MGGVGGGIREDSPQGYFILSKDAKLGIAHLNNKIGLDGFEEVALNALESTQVMIVSVNN